MVRVVAVAAGALFGGVLGGVLFTAACFGYFVARGEAGVNGGAIAMMIALGAGAVGLLVGAVAGGTLVARLSARSYSSRSSTSGRLAGAESPNR